MMKCHLKHLLLLLVGSALGGCVGFAAGTYGKYQMVRENFGLAPKRNEFTFIAVKYTEQEVVKLWGMPDSRSTKGSCTVLGFKNGTSWSGAGVFVGIAPVPLAVPSGSYWNYIYPVSYTHLTLPTILLV